MNRKQRRRRHAQARLHQQQQDRQLLEAKHRVFMKGEGSMSFEGYERDGGGWRRRRQGSNNG